MAKEGGSGQRPEPKAEKEKEDPSASLRMTGGITWNEGLLATAKSSKNLGICGAVPGVAP